MRSCLILLLLSFSFSIQAGSRLEGISGSMGESSFKWFSNEEDTVKEEEEADVEEQAPSEILSNNDPYQLVDEEAGCVKEKVYTLDVDNAEQYERLEDFPFTYECVITR